MQDNRDYAAAAIDEWQAIVRDVDLAAYRLVLRLIRAGRIAATHFDNVTSAEGFDVSGDYEVIAALRRAESTPLRPQDLAERLMISAPGMTGRLDRLESAGLITRVPHPADRRATLITLTAAGVAVAERTLRALATRSASLLDGFANRERERTSDALRELLVILDDLPRDT